MRHPFKIWVFLLVLKSTWLSSHCDESTEESLEAIVSNPESSSTAANENDKSHLLLSAVPVTFQSSTIKNSSMSLSELGTILEQRVKMLQENDHNKLDAVFLIDSSSSVGQENFNSELKFVKKLLAGFTISENETRVAVITFSDQDKVVRHVDHISVPSAENHKCNMLQALPNIKYVGGLTYTLGALVEAQSVLEWSRPGVQKAVFLVTDGFSNGGDPAPVADILKGNGTFIFTFGIQSGNTLELGSISSSPLKNFSYLVDSFKNFEAMVRHALHQDLSLGSYQILDDTSPCDLLCSGSENDSKGCCDSNASCSCGTASGHYRCLCNPGFFGSGLKGSCTPCPIGTYHNGQKPGDESICQSCPDPNHITVMGQASSRKSCICKKGFTSRGDLCEVITCPPIYPPEHGFFVKGHGMCPNVFNAACGVRCNVGYTLHGSSIRLCLPNGTWSGKPPRCIVKMCPNPEVPANGDVQCSIAPSLSNDLFDPLYENATAVINQYAVDTECQFSCKPGHILVGSRHRMCLPLARWDGLRTVCKPVTCSPLAKLVHGSITPEACTDLMKLPFGHKCNMACDSGYRLVGPKSRKCGGKGGQWSSKSTSSKCIDNQPPAITCPTDMEVTTDIGEAFSTLIIPEAHAYDNSGKNPIIWSQPAIMSPMKIPIGVLPISFIAMDPSHNQASCNFTISVVDREPPVIISCISPKPIHLLETGRNSFVSWLEPEFYDNSGKKIHVTFSHQPGEFSVGKTDVIVTAFDESGNNSTCILEIVVEDKTCSKQPPQIPHATILCDPFEEVSSKNLINCTMTCDEGYAFDDNVTFVGNVFQLSENGSVVFPCSALDHGVDASSVGVSFLPHCSETILPNSVHQEGVVSLITDSGVCQNFDLLTKIKEKVELELAKQSDNFCKNVSAFSCNILNSNTSCEDIMSVLEEDTNSIHYFKKRSVLEYASSSVREFIPLVAHSYFLLPKSSLRKRDTSSPFSQTGRINVHFKLQSLFERKDQQEVSMNRNIDFTQLKENLSRTFIDFPHDIKGQSLSWVGGAPTLICSDGSAPQSSGLCLKCSPGSFFSTAARKCLRCPVGNYQDLEGQMKCTSCPKNMSTKYEGSSSKRECVYLCRPGSFVKELSYDGKGSVSITPCSLCPPGSYQPNFGAFSCLPCPVGFLSSTRGAKRVDDCFRVTVWNYTSSINCLHNPCLNGGVCRSISLGFVTCDCPVNFLGAFCDVVIDSCNSSPCLNGGQCFKKSPSGYTCRCPIGYVGVNCEEEIDECSPNPCLNNGLCENLSPGFFCECHDGFQGPKCEENLDECSNFPCGDYGVCVDGIANYTCSCFDGYSGKHCEKEPLDFCLESSPCMNGGSCLNLSFDGYRCECPIGYEGDHCQVVSSDSCSPNPCLNGGTCVRKGNSTFSCLCSSYFTGDTCQTSLYTDFVLVMNSPGATDYSKFDIPPADFIELTACLWLQSQDGVNYGTAFSYATKSQFNSFTLTDYNGFVLYVNGERVVTDVSGNDGLWHHVCVLWEKYHGSWQIFLDGSLKEKGSGLSNNNSVLGGGKFILGQEQDSFGGSFSEAESLIGRIYRLDVWDYLLDSHKISELAQECQQSIDGSLVKWSDFLPRLYGRIKVENSTFCSECRSPEPLWRGSITLKKERNGTVASYLCEDGFVLQKSKLQSVERRCLKQGSWEGEVPVCVRRSCGFPGSLPGGSFLGRSFQYTDSVNYFCNFGATLIGNSRRICNADGKWSGQPPICKGLECTRLTAPKHGIMTMKEKTGGIQVGLFSCNEGFHIDGSSTLTCMHDGTWDEAVPDCLVNVCPTPPQFSNSIFRNDSGKSYTYMDIVHYECEHGYELCSQGSGILLCTAEGEWQAHKFNATLGIGIPFPCCKQKPDTCLEPDQLTFGSWVLQEGSFKNSTGFQFGSVLRASCESDFEVFGPKTKLCKDGLWWPLESTQCAKSTCDTEELPVDIPHSVMHLSGEEVGFSARLTCKDGYQLFTSKAGDTKSAEPVPYGSVNWTCTRQGVWIMEENGTTITDESKWLACLLNRVDDHRDQKLNVQCNYPKAPAFGLVTANYSTKYSVNATVTVHCRPGYWLDGPSTSLCTENGTWTGSQSLCKPVICYSIPHYPNMVPSRTTAVGNNMEFGTLLTFVCLPGFHEYGDLSVRCQSNGTWSFLRGTCKHQ